MLHREEIINAVEIQKRSYRLLRWLSDAIDQGFVSLGRAHEFASIGDVTFDWISEHYENLPVNSRPDPDQLRPFSNYFGSYVTSSFDLVEKPGQRLVSSCGCPCPFCSHLENLSHLRVKNLSKRDKKRAREKCEDRILQLAAEENLEITEDTAKAIVVEKPRLVGYSAYGKSLLDRIRGTECRPWALALWRMIAWKPEGSPIAGFVLKAEDIFESENELVAMIARN